MTGSRTAATRSVPTRQRNDAGAIQNSERDDHRDEDDGLHVARFSARASWFGPSNNDISFQCPKSARSSVATFKAARKNKKH
jgi:hypothetical protein